ncbi:MULTISPECIES: hypothetical protein [unclassified Rhizobium]
MSHKVDIFSTKVEREREKKGDWVSYPLWEGVKFHVSSLMLPEYVAARNIASQRLQTQYRDVIPDEIATATAGELMNTYLLHGWEGFSQEYTPQLAAKLMADAEHRPLIQAVEYCARKIAEPDIRYVEADVKNSGKRSDPT